MKRLYLLLLLLSVAYISKGQAYMPMFGYDHEWYVDHYYVDTDVTPKHPPDTLQYTYMEATGDTVMINNKMYYTATIAGNKVPDTTFYFREDSTARVWILTGILNDTTNVEKLLYDFALGVGDSVTLNFDYRDTSNFYYNRSGVYYVDSITTVNTIVGPREAWFLSNPLNTFSPDSDTIKFKSPPEIEWIEQIGSTIMPDYLQRDINQTYFSGGVWDYYDILLCSFDALDKMYHDTILNGYFLGYGTVDSCSLNHLRNSGIDVVGKQNLSLQIAPNPASDYIQLNCTQLNASIALVQIYNVTGQVIYTSTQPATVTNFETDINVAEFVPGMYFVRLSTNNEVGMGRFVKY